MKKTYIITGCAGFIGFHLCQTLLRKKFHIIGIDKISNYYSIKLKKDRLHILKKNKNFHFLKKDINNHSFNTILREKVRKKKIIAIIHLAAQAGVRNSLTKPFDYIYDNILAHTKICEIAKEYKIKRVIYASSSSIYGENNKSKPYSEKLSLKRPLSLYSATKQSVEQISSFYSKYYKIYFIGLRIFTSYGPYGRPDLSVFKLTEDIINKKKVTLLNFGKTKRDFTYIDDTISAIIKTIRFNFKKNKINNYHVIFNIGSGKSYNITELTKLLSNILKINCKINFVKGHATDMSLTLANTDYSKKLLGYSSNVTLEYGLNEFIKWYLKYFKPKI